MSLRSAIQRTVRYFLIDRPAKKIAMAEFADALTRSGATLAARMAAAADSDQQRALLSHIIGIERWGQRRLRVGLGEAAISDEMDGYLPDAALTIAELAEEFKITRQDTVDLARKLADANAGASQVSHNQLGPLTIHGWLAYLHTHANFEGKRIKRP